MGWTGGPAPAVGRAADRVRVLVRPRWRHGRWSHLGPASAPHPGIHPRAAGDRLAARTVPSGRRLRAQRVEPAAADRPDGHPSAARVPVLLAVHAREHPLPRRTARPRIRGWTADPLDAAHRPRGPAHRRAGDRSGRAVGVHRARLGWLLGVGPGGDRLAAPLALSADAAPSAHHTRTTAVPLGGCARSASGVVRAARDDGDARQRGVGERARLRGRFGLG